MGCDTSATTSAVHTVAGSAEANQLAPRALGRRQQTTGHHLLRHKLVAAPAGAVHAPHQQLTAAEAPALAPPRCLQLLGDLCPPAELLFRLQVRCAYL